MKKSKSVTMLAFAALMAGVLMLSACNNNNNSGDDPSNTTTPANNSSGSNAPSNDANQGGNQVNGDNGDGNSTNAPAGNSGNSGNTGGTDNGNVSTPPNAEDGTAKMLKAMLALAKEGKVEGIPFQAIKGLTEDVEKEWGKADKSDFAGKGIYATYAKKHAVIGYNKGSQIFDVRSDAPELQKLTLKQIEAALGKAAKVTKNGTDSIYTYAASKTYELRFVIPADTGKVDHISVYAPSAAVNNMAG